MKKINLLDKIFPTSYDFYGMLEAQCQATLEGLQDMARIVETGEMYEGCPLFQNADAADDIRMDMEKKLVDAFTTPFDRQDIYSISVEMDRIIEIVKDCVLAMIAYEVKPDDVVRDLSLALAVGMEHLQQAIQLLRQDSKKGEAMIAGMRQEQKNVERVYRQGMARLFAGADPMLAMRTREVYRHLRDAAVAFGTTVDRYHKIVVRQS